MRHAGGQFCHHLHLLALLELFLQRTAFGQINQRQDGTVQDLAGIPQTGSRDIGNDRRSIAAAQLQLDVVDVFTGADLPEQAKERIGVFGRGKIGHDIARLLFGKAGQPFRRRVPDCHLGLGVQRHDGNRGRPDQRRQFGVQPFQLTIGAVEIVGAFSDAQVQLSVKRP